jgi:hypothetical protein
MTGVGTGELVWLVLAVLLGLGVVIAWIIKAEISRNFFKAEIKKLKSQLEAVEREKIIMIEEMHAFRDAASYSPLAYGPDGTSADGKVTEKMTARLEELEKDNVKLRKELDEAKNSLEEVYKALSDNK